QMAQMASQAVRTFIEVAITQSQLPLLYRNGRGSQLSLPLEALVDTKIDGMRMRNRIPIEQHLPALGIAHERQLPYRTFFARQHGSAQKIKLPAQAPELFGRQETAFPLEHQTYLRAIRVTVPTPQFQGKWRTRVGGKKGNCPYAIPGE